MRRSCDRLFLGLKRRGVRPVVRIGSSNSGLNRGSWTGAPVEQRERHGYNIDRPMLEIAANVWPARAVVLDRPG
jgi:hypothetical protein